MSCTLTHSTSLVQPIIAKLNVIASLASGDGRLALSGLSELGLTVLDPFLTRLY